MPRRLLPPAGRHLRPEAVSCKDGNKEIYDLFKDCTERNVCFMDEGIHKYIIHTHIYIYIHRVSRRVCLVQALLGF